MHQEVLNKPPLVQCSRCHKLGHNATSQRCEVPKGDIRCARCGGTHHKDTHACLCRGSHTVASECECIFPCLNCSSREHNCQSFNCLDRDNYRIQHHKPNPPTGKDKVNTGLEVMLDHLAQTVDLPANCSSAHDPPPPLNDRPPPLHPHSTSPVP